MSDLEIVPFQREDGDYDWHLVAANGLILCGSVQGFTEMNDCLESILRVRKAFSEGVKIRGIETLSESDEDEVRTAGETEVSDQHGQASA